MVDKNNFYEKSECKFIYMNSEGNINNNSGKSYNLICFVGIESLNEYVNYNNSNVENILKNLTSDKNNSIIIIEGMQQVKEIQFENWYKNYIDESNGIWIGSGISDQYCLKTSQSGFRLNNNCTDSFGYVIKNGNAKFVKLLEMSSGDDGE